MTSQVHLPASGRVTRALVLVVRFYQRWISPAMGAHCRFAPSCSQFTVEALQVYGPVRGGWLAIRRLGRCHPWHPGGFDPLPTPAAASATMDPSTPAITSATEQHALADPPQPRQRRAGASS